MSKSTAKNEPTNYPEYAVHAETIGRFFSPPLASSTFHDFVNKGKIVPMKGIPGFYLLNVSAVGFLGQLPFVAMAFQARRVFGEHA